MDNQIQMDSIPMLVSMPEEDEDAKGMFIPDAEVVLQSIPVDKLRQNLNKVCAQLGSALQDVKQVGNFKLKEVSVQVEVSAEGGVELIGTATLGGKGAITLTFGE